MRTTIAIDDALLQAARQRAREQGWTLAQYVEEALRRHLAAPVAAASLPVVPVFRSGNGFAVGTDAGSNRSLFDALDSADQPR